MSLHHDDSDSSGFSFLFLLPWWIFVPLLAATLIGGVIHAQSEAKHLPEWEVKASASARSWLTKAYGGGEIISARHEKEGIFHFNGKTKQQIVAFDCDQAGACELCAE
jgi:hypothetical protein